MNHFIQHWLKPALALFALFALVLVVGITLKHFAAPTRGGDSYTCDADASCSR